MLHLLSGGDHVAVLIFHPHHIADAQDGNLDAHGLYTLGGDLQFRGIVPHELQYVVIQPQQYLVPAFTYN